jgi:hypothetical protein
LTNGRWKIEWCDDRNGAERPAISTRLLTGTIARIRETASKEPDTVTSEVFQEDPRNSHFRRALVPALRHDALD